nr:uncharacterized protein LOC106689527 [Halyomorpha halys]
MMERDMWSLMSCPEPKTCTKCNDSGVTIVNPYTFLEGVYNLKCLKKEGAAKQWAQDCEDDSSSSSSESSSSSSSSSSSDYSDVKSEAGPKRRRSGPFLPIARSCTCIF